MLTHIENTRICFFDPQEADCDVLSKQKTDEIEEMHFCYIFNILCRYSTRDFELYTTDYNTTKAHINEQILV